MRASSLLFRRLSLLLVAVVLSTLSPALLVSTPAASAASNTAPIEPHPAVAPLPAAIAAPRALPPAAFAPAPAHSGASLPTQAPSAQLNQSPPPGSAANALLSEGMRATASDSPYEWGSPSKANDDNTFSGWYYSRGFPDAVDYPQWWQVDLGAAYQFSQVVVQLDQGYGECGASHAYTIETSSDNATFAPADTSSGNVSGRETYIISGTGRYVRITFTGGYDPCGVEETQTPYNLDLLDVDVYGVAAQSPRAENPAEDKCECQQSEGGPFNTRTGFYWYETTDLQLTTPGAPLSWSRLFSSPTITETQSGLGFGWHHSFSSRLITPDMVNGEPGTFILVTEKGNQRRFQDLGFDDGYSGETAPLPGITAELIRGTGVYTVTQRDQSLLAFDDVTGRLLRQSDPQGQQLNLTYDGAGRLTRIEDAQHTQRFFQLSYNGTDTRISSVTDGVRTIFYTYDGNGDLQTVIGLRGPSDVTTYTYASHLLTSVVNPLGQAIEAQTFEQPYTAASRLLTQNLQDGRSLAVTYLANATIVTTTTPDGLQEVKRIGYDSTDTVTGVEQNGIQQSESVYNQHFEPGTRIDANGNTTSIEYNDAGQPTQLTNALGQTAQTQYDALSRPTVVTDTFGRRTELAYDSDDPAVTKNLLVRQTTSITGTFPGFTTQFSYTGVRLTERQDPTGLVTHYDHDDQGNVLTQTVGLGTAMPQVTTFGYDTLGRVVTTTVGVGTPLVREHVTRYNLDGTVQASIEHYEDGVFEPEQSDRDVVTSYGYDLLGRQIWVRDVYGRYDATHYNGRGQIDWTVRNLTGFSGGASLPATPSAFDPAFPDRNVTTLMAYDGLGRTTLVTQTGLLDGTFSTTTRTFSGSTTRTTATEYDTLSRPVTVTLNYQPGVAPASDVNVQLLTRYDDAGNVTWQRDALGRWQHTQYDALSRPVTVTLNYENGIPLTVSAANTSWSTITDTDIVHVINYTPDGLVAEEIDNYINGEFDPDEPEHDRKTVYTYDALGRLDTITENYEDGDPTTGGKDTDRISPTAYDDAGRIQGYRDPLGRWMSHQYDAFSRLIGNVQNCRDGSDTPAPSDCGGQSADTNVRSEQQYNELGQVRAMVDPQGIVTFSAYDGLGRPISVIQNYQPGEPPSADRNVAVERAYDALGRTTLITDAIGATTAFVYDALGRKIAVTNPALRLTRTGYDGAGAQRWSEAPDGSFTVLLVDGLGRVTGSIQNYQDGVVSSQESVDQDLLTQTAYDSSGRIVATTDPAGRETRFVYDLRDRLIRVTENASTGTCTQAPCNVVTQYQYDRASNRIAVIDARGITTQRAAYDAADQKVSWTDGLGQVTSWSYDRIGRVVAKLDPRGTDDSLTYSYDGLDRLTSTSAPGLSTPITAEYTARGERLWMNDATGATFFAYDALGRTTGVSEPHIGDISYSYNARGERTAVAYPSTPVGTEIGYAYTPDGQLAAVQQGRNTLARYAYNQAGQLDTITRANGAATSYSYDGAGRLQTLHTWTDTGTQTAFGYEVARNDLRISEEEILPPSHLPGTGLVGEYYSDLDYSELLLTRQDATIDFDWGSDAPVPGGPDDNFVAYWYGELEAPVSGEYTFAVTADDGVSLWLDWDALIDERDATGTETYTATVTLVEGQRYPISLEYLERSGSARVQLAWELPGEARQPVPQAVLYPPVQSFDPTGTPAQTALTGTASGLRGTYYRGRRFEQMVLDRVDSDIDFTWDNGSPDSTLPSDNFSVLWRGQVEAPVSGTYTFVPSTDDGVQVWVGGQLLTDRWKDQGPTQYWASIVLEAGQRYDIEVAYYEHGGGATAQLRWLTPDDSDGVPDTVPTTALYPAATLPPADGPGAAINSGSAPAIGAPTRVITYTYDGLSRLTGASDSDEVSLTYDYDLAGNRTSVGSNGESPTFTSFNAANQVVGWVYDAAGNLLSDGTRATTFDPLGRMMSRTSDGITTTYAYNGDGVLTAQSAGDVTTRYTQDLVGPLSQILGDGSQTYIYGHERLASQAESGKTWYATDGLGSVRQTLGEDGDVLATASYDPWGTPQGTPIAPFGFTGELQDAQGLTHLRARWYTPQHGTLLGRDPFAGFLEQPYSQHPFQYAYSSPVMYVDPSGEIAHVAVIGIGLAGLALVGALHASTPQGQEDVERATRFFEDVASGVSSARGYAINQALTSFTNLAEAAWQNKGYPLDAPDNGLQALIFVVTNAHCLLKEGFSLRSPSIDDVIRLGPQVAGAIEKLRNPGVPLDDGLPNDNVMPASDGTWEQELFRNYNQNQRAEIERLMQDWAKGANYESLAHHIVDHSKRHGFGENYLRYISRANAFNERGARSDGERGDGSVLHTRSNGEFRITRGGKIVSYGVNE